MAQQIFIGIDSGTQGTKAIALDKDSGSLLAEAYAQHDLIENPQGRREQDPAWWIAACEQVLDSILTAVDRKSVRAIGVSGQQHGMVALNKAGHVLRPAKLWCDTETSAQCETITRRAGGAAQVIDAIGNSVAAGFTASKILWLAENEPETFESLDCVLLPHDYINFWLTGEKKAEYGDASGTAYFDVRNRKWSSKLLSSIDPSGKLESCLPQLMESDQPVGTVRPEICERFGFSPDVLVSSGGGDNMMGAIGTGNVCEGTITASLGTSGTIYAHAEKPVIDPQGELAAFCSSTGGWLPLICTMNVTVSTELAKRITGADTPTLNSLATNSSPGADGILLLPYFNGERTPALPTATATFAGLTQPNTTPENICRAAMEGPTLGLRYGLDVLRRLDVTPTQIRLVGGGAKSSLWRQIAADIFDCPVVHPVITEAGALGAAIQAMWCHDTANGKSTSIADLAARLVKLDEKASAEPVPANAEIYREVYENYLALDKTMRQTYGSR